MTSMQTHRALGKFLVTVKDAVNTRTYTFLALDETDLWKQIGQCVLWLGGLESIHIERVK
ncbi:MAG: hypothetical protein ACREAA_02865 [Candidatus Polarisedimenticolia bacterium]